MTDFDAIRSKRVLRVAIVGAGLTGIYVAKECGDRGLNYVVFEKASEVGGTWRDNVYPGIGVDSLGGRYFFPFEPKYDWSHHFAPGDEIQAYLSGTATKYGVRDKIRFNTTITGATWRDGGWDLELEDGGEERFDVLILATGFLRVPIIPNWPGRGTFHGPEFHSSAWDTSLDLRGKHVGVVGTGSSGIQITTAIQQIPGCRVTQFIRHPQWVNSIPNPRRPRILCKICAKFPKIGNRAHTRLLNKQINSGPRTGKYGDWRLFKGEAREKAIEAFWEDLNQIKDPILRAKMTPVDPPGCKRTPRASGYYEAIQQPNVEIVRGGVERITQQGPISDDGQLHELDVLVYATGFDTHAYFKPMTIRGVESARTLGEEWAPGPFSYRGLMVPGYPNLFVMHGPYSPVNNIVVPLSTQDMVGFIMKALDFMIDRGVAVAPKDDATQRYLDWIRSSIPRTTWGEGCENWYVGADGYPIVFPFGRDEHMSICWSFDPEDVVTYA